MNRRTLLAGVVGTAGAGVLAACGAEATPVLPTRAIPAPSAAPSVAAQGPAACTNGMLSISGSTALQPLLTMAAMTYQAKCGGARVMVAGGGSGQGLQQVTNGMVQIGASDIFAEEPGGIGASNAKGLSDFQLVVQGFAIVANPKNAPESLTPEQLIAVFTGQVKNFRDVNGPDQAITVTTREAGSGSRAIFEHFGLSGRTTVGQSYTSNGDLATAVLQTPGAIGYVGLATLGANKSLKPVLFDGRDPSVENISDNSYPIWSYGHLYTKTVASVVMTPQARTLTQAFLDYLLSDDVQTTLVPQLGYIPTARVKSRKTP